MPFLKGLKYYIVYCLCLLPALLPLGVLYFISDLMYPIVYHIIRYRRSIVRSNIESSFPEVSLVERRTIEHGFYHFFCDYMVETVKLLHMSEREMRRRIKFTGIDTICKMLEQQQKDFCFVYLGHYGNWEWVASFGYWAPKYIHCAQIYHPLYSDTFDRLFLNIRGQFGGENIAMKQTLRRIVELRKEHKKSIIGFISDQLPKWNSIHHFTPFLNHDTAVFSGTEQIARKFNALVFYGDMHRLARGYYVCDFKLVEDKPADLSEYELTDRYMQMLETTIRRRPEFWLWSHKRWHRTKEEWERRQMEEKKHG